MIKKQNKKTTRTDSSSQVALDTQARSRALCEDLRLEDFQLYLEEALGSVRALEESMRYIQSS